MKTRIVRIALVSETVVLLILLLVGLFRYVTEVKRTELFNETSPDGNYTLLIQEIGEPDFPFGSDHIRVYLSEKRSKDNPYKPYYRTEFNVDIPADGTQAGYRVEWLEDGVQVVLRGVRGSEAYYILPFKTIEE